MCCNLNHDGNDDPKKLTSFQNREVATIVFMGNYEKTKKTRIRLVCETGSRSGSRLRVGKVLAPPQCPSYDGTFN